MYQFLSKNGLKIEKCQEIGTDGCSVIVGKHHAVKSLLRKVNPAIIHVRCIFHSLQLCSLHALKVKPRIVEFIISETYGYFSLSTLRQINNKELYGTIDVGKEPPMCS